MNDYLNGLMAAFVIGLAVITGASWIADAIKFVPNKPTQAEVTLRNPDGWLVDDKHIYRPDGSVCYTFADSLEAHGLTVQFEEWGE